jgi:hypothetical protein
MTLQTQDSGHVVVLLTPATEVDEVEGPFKTRKKEMAVIALIPGLQIQVQGSHNVQDQLVANSDNKAFRRVGRLQHPGRGDGLLCERQYSD